MCAALWAVVVAVAVPMSAAAADDTVLADDARAVHAHQLVERIGQQARAVTQRLHEARDERDIIRLNYIGGKLTAIEGLLRLAAQAERGLAEAVLRRDEAAVTLAQQKVDIAAEKVDRLAQEAATAVGELALYAGATQVKFIYDERLAGPPGQHVEAVFVTAARAGGEVMLQRLPAASPYQ